MRGSTTEDPVLTAPAWVAQPISRLYAAAAGARRRRSRRRGGQRRLRRPVISVGNLTVGGAGKTPVVRYLAALLRHAGEYPAVLSRGYGRRAHVDGVVVVRDATGIRADLARAGDEPLMLARALPGCAVLACPDRHLAGVLAESRLGCTVHLLDDGFQHVALARDLDVLLVTARDLQHGEVLPAGRLREDRSTAALADVWLSGADELEAVAALALRSGVSRVFGVKRTLEPPLLVEPHGAAVGVDRSAPVLLVSGIAGPSRFEAEVCEAGWTVTDHLVFADHHRFDARDVRTIASRARARGVSLVLTTEKDAVRLLPLRPLPFAAAWVPLTVQIEPEPEFRSWLLHRITLARTRRPEGTGHRGTLNTELLNPEREP